MVVDGFEGVDALVPLWFIGPVDDTLVPDPSTGVFDPSALAGHGLEWNTPVRGQSYVAGSTNAGTAAMGIASTAGANTNARSAVLGIVSTAAGSASVNPAAPIAFASTAVSSGNNARPAAALTFMKRKSLKT